jgi:RecB family exonuclease
MTAFENEEKILSQGAEVYTSFDKKDYTGEETEEIKKLVKDNYSNLKISVSMLNNFFECPWKWYFRSFLRLPELKPVYLSLGSVVHSTIEYILKEKSLPTEKDIQKIILKGFEKEEFENKNDLDRLLKKANMIVFDWINNYYKNINKDYKSERSVSLRDKNFPHLLFYGKIDLTEYLSNTEIMVTDFKTGKSKTKNEIEKINDDDRMSDLMRQLSMYSYLLEGDEKNVKVVKSRLLFLEEDLKNKNCLYEAYIDQEKIDLLKKDIKDYDSSVSLGSWPNNKCNFKPYGPNDECQYCKLSQQLLKT